MRWSVVLILIVISVLVAGCVQNNENLVGGNQAIQEGYNPDGTSIQTGVSENESNNTNQNTVVQSPRVWTSFPNDAVVNSLQDCTDLSVFSVPPLKSEDYLYIEPLGHLNPPGHHILPSEWLSVNVRRNGSESIETNVYAPTDITIYEIKHFKFYDNSGNFLYECYDIGFSPCKEIRAWYGDLMPSENLNKMTAGKECVGYSGPSSSNICAYLVNFSVKAGELLGTTGGPKSGTAGMIFGVYDSRINLTGFANPTRYRPDHLHTACPMDYFTEPAKSMMYGFFGWWDGGRRTVEPICGTIMQDVVGTAQGSWFDAPPGDTNMENEGKAISLIHDNRFGLLGELVIGGQVSQAGMVEFTTTHTGTINREPSEVTADGKIYCYENYDVEHVYTGLTGKFILQLVDANTLKIEHKDGSCTNSEVFTNPYTYQR